MCDCASPPRTRQGLWKYADAVVHVRITDHDKELPAPPGFFKQTAEALEVLKRHRVSGPPDAATRALHELLRRDPSAGSIRTIMMEFLQNQLGGAPNPYDVGEEFVLFLRWRPDERTFVALFDLNAAEHNDTATTFVIKNGRVVRSPAPWERYTGRPVDNLLVDLRQLSSQK